MVVILFFSNEDDETGNAVNDIPQGIKTKYLNALKSLRAKLKVVFTYNIPFGSSNIFNYITGS